MYFNFCSEAHHIIRQIVCKNLPPIKGTNCDWVLELFFTFLNKERNFGLSPGLFQKPDKFWGKFHQKVHQTRNSKRIDKKLLFELFRQIFDLAQANKSSQLSCKQLSHDIYSELLRLDVIYRIYHQGGWQSILEKPFENQTLVLFGVAFFAIWISTSLTKNIFGAIFKRS